MPKYAILLCSRICVAHCAFTKKSLCSLICHISSNLFVYIPLANNNSITSSSVILYHSMSKKASGKITLSAVAEDGCWQRKISSQTLSRARNVRSPPWTLLTFTHWYNAAMSLRMMLNCPHTQNYNSIIYTGLVHEHCPSYFISISFLLERASNMNSAKEHTTPPVNYAHMQSNIPCSMLNVNIHKLNK